MVFLSPYSEFKEKDILIHSPLFSKIYKLFQKHQHKKKKSKANKVFYNLLKSRKLKKKKTYFLKKLLQKNDLFFKNIFSFAYQIKYYNWLKQNQFDKISLSLINLELHNKKSHV